MTDICLSIYKYPVKLRSIYQVYPGEANFPLALESRRVWIPKLPNAFLGLFCLFYSVTIALLMSGMLARLWGKQTVGFLHSQLCGCKIRKIILRRREGLPRDQQSCFGRAVTFSPTHCWREQILIAVSS